VSSSSRPGRPEMGTQASHRAKRPVRSSRYTRPARRGEPAVLAGMPPVALDSGRLERGCEANPARQRSEEHDRGSGPGEEAVLLESAINAGELTCLQTPALSSATSLAEQAKPADERPRRRPRHTRCGHSMFSTRPVTNQPRPSAERIAPPLASSLRHLPRRARRRGRQRRPARPRARAGQGEMPGTIPAARRSRIRDRRGDQAARRADQDLRHAADGDR
jgi:hypothetical protein